MFIMYMQANDEERSTGGGGLSLTLDDLEAGSPQAEHTQSDGRIILDDVDWDLVSEQHGTRSAAQCLTKWYTQLAPSMVTTGQQNRLPPVAHSDPKPEQAACRQIAKQKKVSLPPACIQANPRQSLRLNCLDTSVSM